MQPLRQGDVLLIPASETVTGTKLLHLTLAEGEVTGHRHRITQGEAELRRVLIQGIGYDRIVQDLEAVELDAWREYSLLKIQADIDVEPIHLLKMTCPSTNHIHVLRVPPKVTSARAAIRWANGDIDPEAFAAET
jgi:hypothetical protein